MRVASVPEVKLRSRRASFAAFFSLRLALYSIEATKEPTLEAEQEQGIAIPLLLWSLVF